MDIEAALKYPTTDEDEWVKTTLIGGGVFLVAWTIMVGGFLLSYVLGIFTFGIGTLIGLPVALAAGLLISAVVGGYVVEVMRRTIRGDDDPPRFQDVGDLVRDGLSVAAIAILYQLPMAVLAGVAVVLVAGLFGIGAVLEIDALTSIGVLLGVFGQFLFFAVFGVYSIAVGYLMPVSVCTFAQEGSIRDSFAVDRLKTVATSSEYAVAWMIGFGINFFASQFLQILYFFVVGFFVQFYLTVVVARIVAGGYADALEAEPPQAPDATQSSTSWED